GRPLVQIATVNLWPDNLGEVLKDEEELDQLIERFIIATKRCAVPVRHEQTITQPVDGADLQFREVACIPNLAGRSPYAIAEFKGRLLRKGTDDQFAWRRLAEQEEVHGPQHQTKGLARTWPSNDQQRPFPMADNGPLCIIQGGVSPQERWGNSDSKPSLR